MSCLAFEFFERNLIECLLKKNISHCFCSKDPFAVHAFGWTMAFDLVNVPAMPNN